MTSEQWLKLASGVAAVGLLVGAVVLKHFWADTDVSDMRMAAWALFAVVGVTLRKPNQEKSA